MAESGRFAYVTGGASGIGKAIVSMLVSKGAKVFIADRDISAASSFAESLNKNGIVAHCAAVDVADWNQQAKTFSQAVVQFGRIDYVYPIAGIGERTWIPNDPHSTTGFEMPDLTTLDVDLNGVLYTIALALQQFRRQDVKTGFRGKIGCVASVCGFYCVPTLPIYTAAKHAVTGFVRSYGKYLPEERITLNAVSPHVVRTSISTGSFYDSLEAKGLLTPIDGVIKAFEDMLGENDVSGEIFEVGPRGDQVRKATEYMDKESGEVCDLLSHRGRPLQLPR